jgi:hypothetical protein
MVVSSAYISKYRLSMFNSYDWHPCLINSISMSLTYMAYTNDDKDSPCMSPIKNSEKLRFVQWKCPGTSKYENVQELQNMINVVNVCSNEYNLHVNLLKTKVVIFRNRGNIKILAWST